nr:Chain B, 12-mer from Gag-Pro polyprotein [HTLV-1 isolate Mel 15]
SDPQIPPPYVEP